MDTFWLEFHVFPARVVQPPNEEYTLCSFKKQTKLGLPLSLWCNYSCRVLLLSIVLLIIIMSVLITDSSNINISIWCIIFSTFGFSLLQKHLSITIIPKILKKFKVWIKKQCKIQSCHSPCYKFLTSHWSIS